MGFSRQEYWSGVSLPTELFQILKDDAFKLLHSICQQIWKTQQWLQDWKRSVFINPKERQCQRMFKVRHKLHSSHMLAKQCSKLSNSTWAMNFKMLKLNLKKAEEPESNCQHLLDHRKSQRIIEKCLQLIYWLLLSIWLCGSQQTVENSSRDRNTRQLDLPPEKSVCRSRSNS